jgi:hypothetical protein
VYKIPFEVMQYSITPCAPWTYTALHLQGVVREDAFPEAAVMRVSPRTR